MADENLELDDVFEQLRQRSTRSSTANEEMEAADDSPTTSGGNFLSKLSPQQRLILVVLLFVDVIVVCVGLFMLMNYLN